MFATTVLLGMEPAPHGRSPWSLVFGAQGLALELEDAQCLLLHFGGLHAQPLALANSCFLHIVRGTPAGPTESLVEHIKAAGVLPCRTVQSAQETTCGQNAVACTDLTTGERNHTSTCVWSWCCTGCLQLRAELMFWGPDGESTDESGGASEDINSLHSSHPNGLGCLCFITVSSAGQRSWETAGDCLVLVCNQLPPRRQCLQG